MDWPRFQLTKGESKYSIKYEDPRKRQQRVLRRIYYNELNISSTVRSDSSTFQISRRSRVVAMTFCGDVDRFLLEIIDISGEQYTAGPVHIPLLCNGWINEPNSGNGINTGSLSNTPVIANGTLGPYIFEPNIVVAPNQTIQLNTTPVLESDTTFTYLLGVTLHVVEFPGAPGSPL